MKHGLMVVISFFLATAILVVVAAAAAIKLQSPANEPETVFITVAATPQPLVSVIADAEVDRDSAGEIAIGPITRTDIAGESIVLLTVESTNPAGIKLPGNFCKNETEPIGLGTWNVSAQDMVPGQKIPVSLTYLPDAKGTCTQTQSIYITDSLGNKTEVVVTLTITVK